MKIILDTGYKPHPTSSRCYYVSVRTVDFEDAAPEEVQAFIDAERKGWYGQEFSARVEGQRINIRKGVDSGD